MLFDYMMIIVIIKLKLFILLPIKIEGIIYSLYKAYKPLRNVSNK